MSHCVWRLETSSSFNLHLGFILIHFCCFMYLVMTGINKDIWRTALSTIPGSVKIYKNVLMAADERTILILLSLTLGFDIFSHFSLLHMLFISMNVRNFSWFKLISLAVHWDQIPPVFLKVLYSAGSDLVGCGLDLFWFWDQICLVLMQMAVHW